ncbi:MAG: hypothetical protein EOP39_27715 [Rubrivivax sp.]|nr:MAG: hypothetical protein EOP39_27715 [Rubrivivax sp.]
MPTFGKSKASFPSTHTSAWPVVAEVLARSTPHSMHVHLLGDTVTSVPSWWFQPGVLYQGLFWWMAWLAAACFGFLLLNWAPAKIFMGDAGSYFLGFIISFFALATVALGWLSLWQWLILGALFLADATVTLARRLRLRERLFEAHRRHAYQRLSRRWKSHRKATGLYIAINVIWLLPMAALAGDRYIGLLLALVAYAPVVAMMWMVGAGRPEEKLA